MKRNAIELAQGDSIAEQPKSPLRRFTDKATRRTAQELTDLSKSEIARFACELLTAWQITYDGASGKSRQIELRLPGYRGRKLPAPKPPTPITWREAMRQEKNRT